MKKFIVLLLVLGLATYAQAGLIFTVDGEPQLPEIGLPGDAWYPILPSDIIELDLELDAVQTIKGYNIAYVLSNPQAEFIWDGASRPEYPGLTDIEFPAVFEMASKMTVSEPQNVTITGSQLFGAALQGPLVIMRELYIHCLQDTDVILEIVALTGTVINGENIPDGTVLHTLTIHQIPEPMTIGLLGLGSLFALRRKKR